MSVETKIAKAVPGIMVGAVGVSPLWIGGMPDIYYSAFGASVGMIGGLWVATVYERFEAPKQSNNTDTNNP